MKKSIINKIIFYTILVLCISAFSCYPKSYSKYLKDEVLVKYNVKFDRLYAQKEYIPIILSTSTYKTVNYSVTFDRSQVMKEYDKEQHLIITIEQPTCEITNIYSKGSVDINNNEATIIYDTIGTDRITVDYKCNVLDIKKTENDEEVIYANIDVYEKFIPENNEPYLYTHIAGTKKSLDEYYIEHPEFTMTGNKLTLHKDAEDKYTVFTTWIKYLTEDYDNELITYTNSVYDSEDDIKNTSNTLEGISVSYDEETGNYTYEIDDNFIGYARTYYSYQISDGLIKMYFSNEELTEEDANRILRDYLEMEYEDEDINKIMQYVSKYGSINHILKPKEDGTYNEIAGFINDAESDGVKLDSLMQYVNVYIDKKIIIEYDERAIMYEFYKKSLKLAYDFITDDLYKELKNINIYMSIGKNANNVTETKVAYSDYFAVQDPITKKYVLVNVYSSEDRANTRVEVIELTEADSLTLTQTNNKLDFSITVDNTDTALAKTNVINMVAKLDGYFETDYEFSIVDELFTSSPTKIDGITSVINENKVTISYTIVLPTSNVEENELTGTDNANNDESTETNDVNNNEVIENNNTETE